MSYKINLGAWNSIFAVPTSVVDNYIKLASGENLKVLLYFLRNSGSVFLAEDAAAAIGISSEVVNDALSFWSQRGLISINEGEITPSNNSLPQVVFKKNEQEALSEISVKKIQIMRNPEFKPIEIAETVRGNKAADFLFKKCEQLFGRPLKHNEQNTLMIVLDDTGIPPEVAIMLVDYCYSLDKATPAYIKAVALDWFERGIKTIDDAEKYIDVLKNNFTTESRLKKLFGLNNSFSKKQKEFISHWTNELGFTFEMLEEAHERTLNGANGLSFPYMNKILESWFSAGIKEPAQIENVQKKTKEEKTSSFDINELDMLEMQKYSKKG